MSNINIIIYFTISNNNFRLVVGSLADRNDVEKESVDRLGHPMWEPIGYNKAGMPTAEWLLQLALLSMSSNLKNGCSSSYTAHFIKDEHGNLEQEIRLGRIES